MKENNKLKVVHTTWEEFLKEHPVKEVVDMHLCLMAMWQGL